MEEILSILDGLESVAIAVLIWRTLVADREREKLHNKMDELLDWFKAIVDHILRKTDLR